MSLVLALQAQLKAGRIVPYLGPGMLSLTPGYSVPASSEVLAAQLTAKVSVPHKIRQRLTQAAQFIENFKHRNTLVGLMNDAFVAPAEPSGLHRVLAQWAPPLIVDCWYDQAMAAALATHQDWVQVQGLSQSQHFGTWTGAYDAAGRLLPDLDGGWNTLLYKPWGGVHPAGNYLVSDADFVEVLTEIDIQTPIPAEVQALRAGRSFLFLGCRFNDQLTRAFARQIIKRSAGEHWAVLPDTPTRMEQRFLDEQHIHRIDMPLAEFAEALLEPQAVAS